jgi:hypothetical protein
VPGLARLVISRFDGISDGSCDSPWPTDPACHLCCEIPTRSLQAAVPDFIHLNDAQRSAEAPLATGMSPLDAHAMGLRSWRKAAQRRNAIELRAPLIRDVNRLQKDDCGDQSPEARADCRVQASNELQIAQATAGEGQSGTPLSPTDSSAFIAQKINSTLRFSCLKTKRRSNCNDPCTRRLDAHVALLAREWICGSKLGNDVDESRRFAPACLSPRQSSDQGRGRSSGTVMTVIKVR